MGVIGNEGIGRERDCTRRGCDEMEVTALFGLSQHATSFLISVSSTVLCCGPHHICSELAGYSAVAVRPDMLRFVSTDWQSAQSLVSIVRTVDSSYQTNCETLEAETPSSREGLQFGCVAARMRGCTATARALRPRRLTYKLPGQGLSTTTLENQDAQAVLLHISDPAILT
jgi:hypothetical protein